MSKCETCNHKEVCSYKDDYAEFAGKVEKINADVKAAPSPFNANAECGHYLNGMSLPGMWFVVKEPVILSNTWRNWECSGGSSGASSIREGTE